MAKSSSPRTFSDPVLLHPEQELAWGRGGAELSWEAVPGAVSYIVQIFRDAESRALVFEEAVSTTRCSLSEEVCETGATYFWCVVATDGLQESPGRTLRPFNVVEKQTEPQAIVAAAMTEDHEVHAHHDEPAYTAEEAELAALGVEPEGFPIQPILVSVAVVMASVLVIIVVLFMWTDVTHREAVSAAAPTSLSRYPALKATEDAATRRLEQYEVLNDAQGVYQVPIDRVITLLDNEAAQTGTADQIVLPGTRR